MWWSHGDWGWGGWLLMTVGMVAVWSALVWAVLVVARSGSGGTTTPEPNAEEILARRLARGDIDDAEYRRRLATLRGRPAEASQGEGAP